MPSQFTDLMAQALSSLDKEIQEQIHKVNLSGTEAQKNIAHLVETTNIQTKTYLAQLDTTVSDKFKSYTDLCQKTVTEISTINKKTQDDITTIVEKHKLEIATLLEKHKLETAKIVDERLKLVEEKVKANDSRLGLVETRTNKIDEKHKAAALVFYGSKPPDK